MIYFCADDYGISEKSNQRIETCLEHGVLNKVSVLPNGEIPDFKERMEKHNTTMSLHINLVEGYPLSQSEQVEMLLSEDGRFRDSFVKLFFRSLLWRRKELKAQLRQELRAQVRFWKSIMGEETPVYIDSHQHIHMIPLVFQTLMEVVEEERLHVACMRIPAEPAMPYLMTPSLYLTYTPQGLMKHCLLRVLALVNRKEIKKSKIPTTYFMGVMFSGRMTETNIKKLLPWYLKIAEKKGKNIEIGLHPGYVKQGEEILKGIREDFRAFYLSHRRNIEYDLLTNGKF